MVTRRNSSVGSKRAFSDLNRRENEPLTKNRKEAVVVPKANPWSKRAERAKKVVEEEPLSGEEEWKEVKARGRVNRTEVMSPKPLQAEVNMPSGMQYDLEWPALMKVGTPVMFRGLIKSGNLNGTSGVIVGVVEEWGGSNTID